ncbi:MAG: hypothetical protein FWH21_09975, partial [Kiritimatiellaeota bacterium]|nr:hypothetical protein [Kiritimatiellota bacterium]
MTLKRITVLAVGMMLVSAANAVTEVYVAQGAKPDGDGSKGKPFATLEAARDKVRALKKENPDGPYAVVLRDGTYCLTAPFDLTAEDSGTETNPV